ENGRGSIAPNSNSEFPWIDIFIGILPDNRIVCIKKSTLMDKEHIGQFINETKMPLNFRTDSLPTAQLSKGITRLYKLGIEQTWWRWKDRSKGFPNITGSTPGSS
ncbi:hypothetical protein MTR67_039493, partial [Solanum verrucosum]